MTLRRITNMAFAMVAEYGMSKELGYLSLKDSNSPENSIIQKELQADAGVACRSIKTSWKQMAETLLEKEVLKSC
jgi:ATP-dependent Zn protease